MGESDKRPETSRKADGRAVILRRVVVGVDNK